MKDFFLYLITRYYQCPLRHGVKKITLLFTDIMAVATVLNYVMLLEEIFGYLDFESIKNASLVSK